MTVKNTRKSIIIRKSKKVSVKKKPIKTAIKSKTVTKKLKTVKTPASYSIEFCNRCGSIMVPEKVKSSLKLKCRSCNYVSRNPVKKTKVKKNKESVNKIPIIESDFVYLPQIKKICKNCENPSAYFWLQQTKSDDEPPTQFFRCTKCKHTWREHK